MEALLRPVGNLFVMPRNLRVRRCKQGNPKIIGCLVVTVTRKEIDSWCSTLMWSKRGLLHWVTVPVPMGLPSMALIINGCHSSCVGRLNFITVLWSMKLPVALELARAERTETGPDYLI